MCRKSPKSPKNEDRVKQPRVWALGGGSRDLPSLDFSTDKPNDDQDYVGADTQVHFHTLYRSYFKGISDNIELQVYSVTCC
jgi:hypothetical protein